VVEFVVMLATQGGSVADVVYEVRALASFVDVVRVQFFAFPAAALPRV
jgi:hypothetical protein